MVKSFAAGAAVESVTLKTLFDMGMYPGDTNMLAFITNLFAMSITSTL